MSSGASAEIVLGATTTSLVKWVVAHRALPDSAAGEFLTRPSYNSARVLANAVDKVVHLYVATLSSWDATRAQILNVVLHTALPSVWTGGWIRTDDSVAEDLAIALAAKMRDWIADLQASGQVSASIAIRELQPFEGAAKSAIGADAVGYLAAAGLQQWTDEQAHQVYAARLAHIQTALGLRPAELARLLQVSREAVRRWFDGAPIAPERWSEIDRVERAVDLLTGYFKPEVVPSLIRRKIPGLDHKTPLELIYTGQEDKLAALYNAIFDRGVTQ